MFRFDDDHDTSGTKMGHDGVGDLSSHDFLDRETVAEESRCPHELADPNDSTIGDVTYSGSTPEWEDVVGTHPCKRDISDHDEFVAGIFEGHSEDLLDPSLLELKVFKPRRYPSGCIPEVLVVRRVVQLFEYDPDSGLQLNVSLSRLHACSPRSMFVVEVSTATDE